MSPLISIVLADSAHALARHSDSPHLDAELLIARAAGLNRAQLRMDLHRPLEQRQLEQFQALLKRRLQGEPMAYILGERGFWSLDLEVNPAVLIPRPETERLVERALSLLPADKHASVLDLGTGSGAVALAIASERPNTTITATDVSMAALEVARRNATRLQLQIQFIESDWYERLSAAGFDLIVSNPPYIAADDPDLDPAVLSSEPVSALIAGPTGLEAIQTIVKGAHEFLRPAGWLVLEHGWRQGAAVRELLVAAGFVGVASHADLAGNERVTEGQWPHRRP